MVAEKFQILAAPRLDATISRATIEYDKAVRRFVISLSPALEDRDPELGSDLVPRAQRFSYAHEFAHRFLYIERDDGWLRALSAATEAQPRELRLHALRLLSAQEERLCNKIAGQLLVPSEMLTLLAERFTNTARPSEHHLWDFLTTIVKDFQVSRWCAFRQLSKTPHLIQRRLPPHYCLLVFGHSTSKGTMRGRSRLRIVDYWWPGGIDGLATRALFPGIAAANISPALEEYVAISIRDRVANPDKMTIPRPVSESIQVQSAAKAVQLTLNGWSRWWSGGSRPQLAVYGVLTK
jgi:hypothetical protein